MNTCWIVGAGLYTRRNFVPEDGDLIIAADGGLLPLQEMGVTPHLLLGDFDSLGSVPENLPQSIQRITFPVEKDDTDTGLALREGFRRGYRRFALYGCGGGRLDHLFANMQSMAATAKQGAILCLTDPEYDLYCICNDELILPKRPAGTLVSILCHGDKAEGVTITGLQYSLTKETLTSDYPIGVSNHYTDKAAKVSVDKGCIHIMVFVDKC